MGWNPSKEVAVARDAAVKPNSTSACSQSYERTIRSYPMIHLRKCQRKFCTNLFAVKSKKNPQSFCSPECGGRWINCPGCNRLMQAGGQRKFCTSVCAGVFHAKRREKEEEEKETKKLDKLVQKRIAQVRASFTDKALRKKLGLTMDFKRDRDK